MYIDFKDPLFIENFIVCCILIAIMLVLDIIAIFTSRIDKTIMKKAYVEHKECLYVVKFTPKLRSFGLLAANIFAIIGTIVTFGNPPEDVGRFGSIWFTTLYLFALVAAFLSIRQLVYRVIVEPNKLIVRDIFKPERTVLFEEIVSVERKQTSEIFNYESMRFTTTSGKHFNVGTPAYNYEKFLELVRSNVGQEKRKGIWYSFQSYDQRRNTLQR